MDLIRPPSRVSAELCITPRSSFATPPPIGITSGDFNNRKRLVQTIKVSLLLIFPMILLVTMTVMAHVDALSTRSHAVSVKYAIATSFAVAELVRMLQIERGRTSMYLSSNRTNKVIFEGLIESRKNTDAKYLLVSDWSTVDIPLLKSSNPDRRSVNFAIMLGEHRTGADIGIITSTETVRFFTDLNGEMIGTLFRNVDSPQQYKYLVAFDNFVRATEFAGVQRALAAAWWLPCQPSNKMWLLDTHSSHWTMLSVTFRYHEGARETYFRIRGQYDPNWDDIERMVSIDVD